MSTKSEYGANARIVEVPTQLYIALQPGEDIEGIYDGLNCMLIPLQIKEGGDTNLVDYGFGTPRETGVQLGQYDYEDGLPEPDSPDPRMLLANAVAAKMIYWDAMRAIEMKFGDQGGDVSDAAANKLHELVENLAVGLDTPEQAYTRLEPDHVTDMEKIFQDHPL